MDKSHTQAQFYSNFGLFFDFLKIFLPKGLFLHFNPFSPVTTPQKTANKNFRSATAIFSDKTAVNLAVFVDTGTLDCPKSKSADEDHISPSSP